MSQVATLTIEQKKNASILIQRAIAKGITNRNSHAALLSIALKEGGLNLLISEGSYATTSNDRIRKIFSKTKALSDAQLNSLKINVKAFFNFIYSGVAGNGANDGYLFRGAGPNQLTGRGNFRAIGKKISVDLENNPEILRTNPTVAADAFIQYFIDGMETGKRLGKLAQYHSTGINDFKNTTDSLGAFYHANAGWGHTTQQIQADPTGGLAKARSTVNDFYILVSDNKAATGGGFFFTASDGNSNSQPQENSELDKNTNT